MKEGSYVICINDSNWDPRVIIKFNIIPVKGKIYRVRRFIPNFDIGTTEDGIALEGIFGDWAIFKTIYNTTVFEEFHFGISRFREIENPLLKEIEEEKSDSLIVV